MNEKAPHNDSRKVKKEIKRLEAELWTYKDKLATCKLTLDEYEDKTDIEILSAAQTKAEGATEDLEDLEKRYKYVVQENEKLSELLKRIQIACNASTAFAGSDCGPGWRGRIRLGDVRDLFIDF